MAKTLTKGVTINLRIRGDRSLIITLIFKDENYRRPALSKKIHDGLLGLVRTFNSDDTIKTKDIGIHIINEPNYSEFNVHCYASPLNEVKRFQEHARSFIEKIRREI